MIRDLGRKIEEQAEDAEAMEETGQPAPAPIPVQVQEPDLGPMELVQTIVGPLVGPLATFGIVVVFVIFMLLKREDLRDRLIRLAGAQDLSRTTDALDDAAHRVGHYLLMQLVVNVTYGLPVAIGLWFIGVPNPLLWGMLATVLRFVPYVGPIISAFFPLALAIAVDPGWETLVWTGGLLIVIELISNNAVEPWLYERAPGYLPSPSSPRRSSGPGCGGRSACSCRRRSLCAWSCLVSMCRNWPFSMCYSAVSPCSRLCRRFTSGCSATTPMRRRSVPRSFWSSTHSSPTWMKSQYPLWPWRKTTVHAGCSTMIGAR
jgi:hypothetical protein